MSYKKQLKPYQIEAAYEIYNKKKLILGDEMSMGKCAETLAARTLIENRQKKDCKTLIIGPGAVIPHWAGDSENIGQIRTWYHNKKNPKIAKIQTKTFHEDIKNAKDADFVLIPYSTLSQVGKKDSKISKSDLLKLKNLKFQYGILDEGHNAKNPDALKTNAVKNVLDSIEYLAIATGTLIPDTVTNLYMLLSLLDKKSFPYHEDSPSKLLREFYALFHKDPDKIRNILAEHVFRREADKYLLESCPKIETKTLEVMLTGNHEKVYKEIHENSDIKPCSKLTRLLQASIDPNLLPEKILSATIRKKVGKMKSSVYEAIDDLLEEIDKRGGKAVIFTTLKDGIVDKLEKRYEKYGAIVIDGDVDNNIKSKETVSDRETARRKFQNNPNCKVLISTSVMDEGVDLTAATDVIHLLLPYTPAAYAQRNRRPARIGEIKKNKVMVHIIKPVLKSMPTIAEGVGRMLEDKQRIIDYLITDLDKLEKEDFEEIKNGHPEKSKHIKPLLQSSTELINAHFTQLKGVGHAKYQNFLEKHPTEAKAVAMTYKDYWENYYAGNTAKVYGQVIKAIESKHKLKNKLDIACGPFSLSRTLQEPVNNQDTNKFMIEAGKLMEKDKRVPKGNKAELGSYTQLKYPDKSMDLTVCSLALHTSKLNAKDGSKKINEREQAFREMNRVLKKNGYAIAALPHSVLDESDFEDFYGGLNKLGFDVLPFSGFYKGKDSSKFKVYLAALKKVAEPCKEALSENQLEWKMDRKGNIKKRHSTKLKKEKMHRPKTISPEVIDEFYLTKSRKTIDEIVRDAI